MQSGKKKVPAVVIVCDFVQPKKEKFKDYINYIDRHEAVRKNSYRHFDLYADLYMDNNKKTKAQKSSALFTEYSDKLTYDEKQKIKEQFKLAQKNKSLMWQTVISFDNEFLIGQGPLDKNRNLLDEDKIRLATRNAISKLLKSEKLYSSAVWTAAIHYNTDNIHVHIAMVEPYPKRHKIIYQGEEQYKGKFKAKSINLAKSAVINTICDRSKELGKINDLIRNRITKNLKISLEIEKDRELKKQLKKIRKALPRDKRLWKYNINALKDTKYLLDEFSTMYIKIYCNDDFEKLLDELDREENFHRKVYGNSKTSYKNHKIDELYMKMGNTVLNYLFQESKREQNIKIHKKNNLLRKNFKALSDLKKALKKDFQSIKNQKAFEKLENEIAYQMQVESRW